ncbi:FkbM family methyltransferase [Chloroflexota bacterium]
MFVGIRSFFFHIFRKIVSLLMGSSISKVPGVLNIYHFLFRLLYPKKNIIEVEGSKVYVNLDDETILRNTFETYIINPRWNEVTTEKFKAVVKEGDVVLDLGANIGYYSLLAARLTGHRGRVYSFEPEPRNYDLLLKNIEINNYQNIIPNQKAVSDRSGSIKLSISSIDSGAHTIRPTENTNNFKETIDIEMVSLDEYFKGREDVINVIKMDIEGFEPYALKGMNNILKGSPDIKLFIEFYPEIIREAGNSPEEFARSLKDDYGFSITITDDDWKDRRCFNITSIKELMDYFKLKKTVNLFLERNEKLTSY